MLESLNEARHDFASNARRNLSRFNAQLEGVVSTVPESIAQPSETEYAEGGGENEDPSELFHRDVGVQTSLPTSRAPSPQPPASSTLMNLQKPDEQLASVKTSLGSILSQQISEKHDSDELKNAIHELKEYCESLAYIPPASTSAWDNGRHPKGPDDEISHLKKDLRSMKGMLLSAKSFPMMPLVSWLQEGKAS